MLQVSGDWGGDTPPSAPEALQRTKFVNFGGGFCFTDGGIAHDLSEDEVRGLRIPPFAPAYPMEQS